MRRFPVVGSTQLVEDQRLVDAAMWTRHVEITPVPGLEILRDRALALDTGRRSLPFLARSPFSGAPAPDPWAAATVDIPRIAGHLVHRQILDRNHLQALRGTCVDDLAKPAGEPLECRRRPLLVAAVYRQDLMANAWAGLDRRLQLDAVELRRLFQGRQHDHHRARRLVDDIAEPVLDRRRLAELRRPSAGYPPGRMIGMQAVLRLPKVGYSLGAKRPRPGRS